MGGDNNFQYAPNPLGWVDPLGLEYRRGTTRQIKRELNIPMTQHPSSQRMVPMTDKNGKAIFDQNHRPIMTRELTYQVDGKDIVIQDHSAGHQYGEKDGNGDQPCHLNVRPAENTRNGKVEGMKDHYYFEKRNKK